jgi:DNA polymerase III epsilon subunit-like protein
MILTYDTETTGFMTKSIPLSDPRQPRIVQLGAILDKEDGTEAMRLDVVIAHDHTKLDPKIVKSWRENAQPIHGISPEDSMKYGVNESTAIEMFLDFIEAASVIVGQNIKGFDNDLMKGTVRRVIQNEAFDPFAGKNIFDTMLAGQAMCRLPFRGPGGGYKKPNLTELHTHLFGEAFKGAHQAISDVIAARRCFYEMQRLIAAKATAA